jgi:hypothetical protein
MTADRCHTGHLRKMRGQLAEPDADAEPGAARQARYRLPLEDLDLPVDEYLGKTLRLEFQGQIHCIACGRLTKKSWQQGYCFPCTQRLAECDLCIVRPERCHFDRGTCREPEWGRSHCMQPHYVYLANSSGLKVGITRAPQVPVRWIDQGATQALPIFRVDSRYQSGLIEVALAARVADKTDWRRMLKGDPEPLDLEAERERLVSECSEQLRAIGEAVGAEHIRPLYGTEPLRLGYPVLKYPAKIRSLSLDKTPIVEGRLQGIKGQYLIFDTGVVNVRKHAGYLVSLTLPGD